MSKTVTISLSLSPPTSTAAPVLDSNTLSSSAEHSYPVNLPSGPKTNEAFYGALRAAVQTAKEEMGKTLTAWRDAVGDGEKEKEVQVLGKKKGKKAKLEEDLMEEEEEEDDEEE